MTGAAPLPPEDPRPGIETGVLPSVASSKGGISGWMIASGMAVLAIVLFTVLNTHRRSLTAPAIGPRAPDTVAGESNIPPLYVPPVPPPPSPPPVAAQTPAPPPTSRPSPPPQILSMPQQPVAPMAETSPAPPARAAAEPTLVIDAGVPTAAQTGGNTVAASGSSASDPAGASLIGARTGAGTFANRATTVPQGTLIPAVLETALDSDRPGLARAVVQHDVRSFDGSHVLIPRGSRLIGEYRSDARPGQNRILVMWVRLIRPDGATIALDSPASDTLGGSGIKASVNSHFFARFAGAILQSALDVGIALAAQSSNSPVIVALPGTLQGSTGQLAQQTQIPPTLKVKAATSISVFVARDLDFTGVEMRR